MPPSRVRIPPSPLRSTERCPSGLRSATGNRVRAERCVAGSNPALSVQRGGGRGFPPPPPPPPLSPVGVVFLWFLSCRGVDPPPHRRAGRPGARARPQPPR